MESPDVVSAYTQWPKLTVIGGFVLVVMERPFIGVLGVSPT